MRTWDFVSQKRVPAFPNQIVSELGNASCASLNLGDSMCIDVHFCVEWFEIRAVCPVEVHAKEMNTFLQSYWLAMKPDVAGAKGRVHSPTRLLPYMNVCRPDLCCTNSLPPPTFSHGMSFHESFDACPKASLLRCKDPHGNLDGLSL